MKNLGAFLLATLLFASCGSDQPREEEKPAEDLLESTYLIDTITVEKEWGDCQKSDEGCITLLISLPQIKEPDSIGQLINKKILNLMLGNYKDSLESAEAFADYLIDEYKTFSKSLGKVNGWQIENQVDLDYLANEIISVRQQSFENLGGAHPNIRMVLRSYSLVSSKRIYLQDVFKPNYEDSLLFLCQYHLKNAINASLLSDFGPDSRFTKDIDFTLSDNFLLSETGINFIHISENLQSSGIGPIEFGVPYTELIEAGILNEKGALGFLLGMVNP